MAYKKYKLYWSNESLNNLEDILDYLNKKWTSSEVEDFKQKLRRQIDIILSFPEIFPVSQIQPRLRKAVLSKQTTVFYEINDDRITIVYLFVVKKNPNKIK